MKLTLIALSSLWGTIAELPGQKTLQEYSAPTITRVYDGKQNEVLQLYKEK